MLNPKITGGMRCVKHSLQLAISANEQQRVGPRTARGPHVDSVGRSLPNLSGRMFPSQSRVEAKTHGIKQAG